MKKILSIILIMLVSVVNVQAKAVKKDFSTVISDSGVDIESIAVSIKNAGNNKVVYALNDKMLMSPASVQKVLTTPVSYETLGGDYLFKTGIYSRNEGCYVIKLGADPYLSSKDLKALVKNVKPESQRIFIDDRILDSKTWGEGWQWDDDYKGYKELATQQDFDRF